MAYLAVLNYRKSSLALDCSVEEEAAVSEPISIESLCGEGETQAQEASLIAKKLVSLLHKLSGQYRSGLLRDVGKSLETISSLRLLLDGQLTLLDGFRVIDLDLLLSKHLADELKLAAKARGLSIVEHNGSLHFFPYQIRILPRDRAVVIGTHRETNVRPSVLASRLSVLSTTHPPVSSASFVEVLFQAYRLIAAQKLEDTNQTGPVVPLMQLYKILTLRPGASKEYSLLDFSRDVYLLDRDGPGEIDTSEGKHRISFAASTGTKLPGSALTLITEQGLEKRYYGIAFTLAP